MMKGIITVQIVGAFVYILICMYCGILAEDVYTCSYVRRCRYVCGIAEV